MTVVNVSLDLETWGTTPGCDIRSIGACVFDPATGEIPCYDPTAPEGQKMRSLDGAFYLATSNPRGYWGNGSSRDRFFTTGKSSDRLKYPLKRDPKTEQWWSEQSAEAQAAFENPVDLRDALRRFAFWLQQVTSEKDVFPVACKIWCHGPAFDIPILAAAYEAVGLPVPWHYRAPRDTRTAFDMAGIDDHSAWLATYAGEQRVQHHALSDAVCQARAVCGAYERVQSPDREFHVGRVAMQQYADWSNQQTDIGGAWYKIEQAIRDGAQ